MIDDDLYKVTMAAAIYRHYPYVSAKHRFICRSQVKLGYLKNELHEQVLAMEGLRLQPTEASFLTNLGYLPAEFISWFKDYRYNPNEVYIGEVNDQLIVETDGDWLRTIFWEVKLLSTINELYFQKSSNPDWHRIGIYNLSNKIGRLSQYPRLRFSDFGTRRRFSRNWQDEVVFKLAKSLNGEYKQFVGTSNMYLAMLNGLTPIGTMAHEFISGHLGLVGRIETAQRRALHTWLETYVDRLGYALTDTFTTDAFFRDFDIVLARAFSGLRQDSGDPFIFAMKAIAHYKKLGIDPRTKYIVFSDGLDVESAIRIWTHFAGEIGISFGIGTNLTNTVGVEPLQIVMKMIECNGVPVIKLSDTPEKATGDEEMIQKVKQAYGVI